MTSGSLACFSVLCFAASLNAQTAPTAYTITSAGLGDASTFTIYRNGASAVMERITPAQPAGAPASRVLSFYDFKAGTSYTWEPAVTPITCSAGRFSGDWGDPFSMSAELKDGIARGELKPGGTETLNGIATTVYNGGAAPGTIRIWYDAKDNLVVRAIATQPSGPAMTLVDIRKVSFGTPPASLFVLPPACAGMHPPPTPAEAIAAETGDSADNFVNAIYGPGSGNSCSIVLRIVNARTMAPMAHKYQVAIDTTYNVDNPPHYTFGVGDNGVSTFAGGGLHELTNQIRDGMIRIDNPPAYFNLSLSFMRANEGANAALIYRQCFAPVTVLYFVLKNPDNPGDGGDYLYAKSGKYATLPPAR